MSGAWTAHPALIAEVRRRAPVGDMPDDAITEWLYSAMFEDDNPGLMGSVCTRVVANHEHLIKAWNEATIIANSIDAARELAEQLTREEARPS